MKHLSDSYVLGLLKSSKTSAEIARLLGITKRYANKLRQKLKAEGGGCLANKNKGKQRKWRTDERAEEKIAALYATKHDGFNWTHFMEKLNGSENIKIGYRPLYRMLTPAGFASPKARKENRTDNARPVRERRGAFGELLQIDASIHPWFKGSGLKYALHGAIDDATGTVMGPYFDDEETLSGYYHMLERIIPGHGVPKTLYTDKRTVFTYNRLSDKDKTIENNTNVQFRRCCGQLGAEIITTSVPQAKGRIERLWETLQSRLLNELALNGITNIRDANEYLPRFEREFNGRFAFDPKGFDSSFAPWGGTREELGCYLSTQHSRVTDNGSSFSLDCSRYRLVDGRSKAVPVPAKSRISVFRTLGGKIIAVYGGEYYETRLATASKKHRIRPVESKAENKAKWKPAPDHPWRKFVIACR